MSKYHMIPMCGGQSMMLNPSEHPVFSMKDVSDSFGDSIIRASEDMTELMYKDIKITVYPNGSMLFYHYTDFPAAMVFADEVFERITKKA